MTIKKRETAWIQTPDRYAIWNKHQWTIIINIYRFAVLYRNIVRTSQEIKSKLQSHWLCGLRYFTFFSFLDDIVLFYILILTLYTCIQTGGVWVGNGEEKLKRVFTNSHNNNTMYSRILHLIHSQVDKYLTHIIKMDFQCTTIILWTCNYLHLTLKTILH